MSSFGIAVREARIRLNMSLRELSRRANIGLSYLSRIENGHCPPPSGELVELLAKELDEDRDEFLILARRIDPELKSLASEYVPQLESVKKFIKFMDSSVLHNDDDPIGGIQGILELLVAESMITDTQMNTVDTFKYVANLYQELSSHEGDTLPKNILIRREMGAIALGSITQMAEDGSASIEGTRKRLSNLLQQLKTIEADDYREENNGTT